MSSIFVAGADPGNADTTLLVAGKPALTLPSLLGSGSLAHLNRLRSATGQTVLAPDEYVLDYHGHTVFVGQLALTQSNDASSARGDISRYWNGHTTRLLLVALAARLPATSTVRLVTGLPVEVWSRTTVHHVQQALQGTHHLHLNGKPFTLTIDAVAVVMEGAGALAVHGRSQPVPQAVIDIGGRTTDLFFAQGMQPVLTRCAGLPVGVDKVSDLLQQQFGEQYGRDLHPAEARAALQSYATGTAAPPVYVGGQAVEVGALVPPLVQTVGQEIARFVSQTWRSSEQGAVASDAAQVLLIGGGAHYFAPVLQTLIPHLKVVPQPEQANAAGYLALGRQLSEADWARLRRVRQEAVA